MDPILVLGGRCQLVQSSAVAASSNSAPVVGGRCQLDVQSALRSVHYIVVYDVYAATQRYRSNATMVISKRGRHSTVTPAAVECFVAVSFDLHAVE